MSNLVYGVQGGVFSSKSGVQPSVSNILGQASKVCVVSSLLHEDPISYCSGR